MDALDNPITKREITRTVALIKTNKSPGVDDIHAKMINTSTTDFTIFGRIVQSYFRYRTAWTSAMIVPIYQSGDKNDPGIYRGVSLLSILGKVFVHISNKRPSGGKKKTTRLSKSKVVFVLDIILLTMLLFCIQLFKR